MTRFGWTVFAAVCAVMILIGIGLVVLHAKNAQTTSPASTATTTARTTAITNPSQLSIYTNGEYGFSFFYPADGVVTDISSSTNESLGAWRAGSTGNGTSIVRIQTSQGDLTYGVSSDAHERSVCLSAGPAETVQTAVTIGSTTWQHFTFEKVGTDHVQHIISYRTLRRNECAAFEIKEPESQTVASTTYAIETSISSFSFVE